MSTAPQDPLAAVNDRLKHLEAQVAEIHTAIVGKTDGTHHGLQARVAKLEAWARWLAAVVTALVIGALSQVLGMKGLR